MDSSLRAPLLGADQSQQQQDAGGGRGLSIAALAAGRRSSCSLRSESSAPATPPAAAAFDKAAPESEIHGDTSLGARFSGQLRFAPNVRGAVAGGSHSRRSSLSSGGGGRAVGLGGAGGATRLSSFSSMGVGKDTAVLHRSASNKVGGRRLLPPGGGVLWVWVVECSATEHTANSCYTQPQMRSQYTQLMQLSAAYQSRRQLEEEEGVEMPKWVIHPYDQRWVAVGGCVGGRGGDAMGG